MKNLELIQQGAEAKIFLDKTNNLIIKERIPKGYRIPEIDDAIRKRRTKSERKILIKANKIIPSPQPIENKNDSEIQMQYLEGEKLSRSLDDFEIKEQKKIMKKIGKNIAILHQNHIVHGDLTTSNMIFLNDKVHFIDFGLGFISTKTEAKAVDLHLLKQALEAKHFNNWKILFGEVIKSYERILGQTESKKILERLTAVERRGRYRN